MDRSSGSLLCGTTVLVIGATVILGWVFHNPTLIQLRPGMTGMVLNTAVGLTLAGLVLALARPASWSIHIRIGCGVVLFALGLTALAENLFDVSLGLDWAEIHKGLGDSNPRPGRMAPNTGAGFVAIGLAFILARRTTTLSQVMLHRGLALTTIVIALSGLFGHFLKLEMLYGLHTVARMPLHTALGMGSIGLGLWLEVRHAARSIEVRNEGREILPLAIGSLVVVVLIASISVFTFMQDRIQRITAEHLRRLHSDRSQFFANVIEHSTEAVKSIANRPNAQARMRKLYTNPEDATALAGIKDVANSFLPHGFSWLAFYQRGRLVVSVGKPLTQPELDVPLRGVNAQRLLWHDGYHLRVRAPMRDQEGNIGEIIAEQPLSELTKLAANTNQWGDTGEMLVCGRGTNEFRCFPGRFHTRPFTVPFYVDGTQVPMANALRGGVDTGSSFDYRGQPVFEAHGPISDFGLGMVLKMDWEEMYAPIRQELEIMLPVLAIVVAASIWLLRRRVRPLLAQLIESRHHALANEAFFRAAAENNLDAFFLLDSVRGHGSEIVDFEFSYANINGARLISSQSPEDLVGNRLCAVLPFIRIDGHLEKYKQVARTGEPLTDEFRVSSPGIKASWLSQQVVRLGDGISITFRDITERKTVEERLKFMAQNDTLTGLPNRALFLDRLEQTLMRLRRRRRPMALLYLDIDHFKNINDTLGHAAGDELLCGFADRLRNCVRTSDTAARLAGDEFTVILDELQSVEDPRMIAERIIAELRKPMTVAEQEIVITCSIGIAHYDGRESMTVDMLMERADRALYDAKRNGRNYYAVYSKADLEGENAQAVESD